MNKFKVGDKVTILWFGQVPEAAEVTAVRYAAAIRAYIYTVKVLGGPDIEVSEVMLNHVHQQPNTFFGGPVQNSTPHYHPLRPGDLPDDAVLHNGHTVIDNMANGKQFKYCKDCKVEV